MLINLHALARASGRVLVAHSSDPGLGAPYQAGQGPLPVSGQRLMEVSMRTRADTYIRQSS